MLISKMGRAKVLSIFIAGVLFAPLTGCMDKQTKRDTMEKRILNHLQEIYKADEYQQIFKWPRPLKYYLHPVIIEESDHQVEEYFPFIENLFNDISAVSGLEIERIDEPDDSINMSIFFTSDPYRVAMHQNVKMHLKSSKSTDEEYEELTRERVEGRHPFFSATRTWPVSLSLEYGHKPVLSMNVITLKWVKQNRRLGFLAQVIYGGVIFTREQSDYFVPSITNKNHGNFKALKTLTSFDKALLQALYDDEIQYGMPLDMALPLMARRMTQILVEDETYVR